MSCVRAVHVDAGRGVKSALMRGRVRFPNADYGACVGAPIRLCVRR
jgi:hypothetical protein